MDFGNVVSALIGACVASLPALYRLLTGRAKYAMSDHALVVGELRREILRLVGRIDQKDDSIAELQNRLLAAEKHNGECDEAVKNLKAMLEKATGHGGPGTVQGGRG